VDKRVGRDINFEGKTIVKNTIYNLLGYGIPILFALIFIPPLIVGLGKERFGILSLVWIVIGYFSFLDFGIGRSLTKIISEKMGQNKYSEIPTVFWSSLIIMSIFSVAVTLVALTFIPSFLNNFLNISNELKPETYKTFYVVTLSIPLISTTAGLRGVLEAYQKFLVVNLFKTVMGVFTFLGPIIVLTLTNSLFWIVIFLIIIRFIIWLSYIYMCLKVNDHFKKEFGFNFNAVKPTLKFSLWISLSNIISPIILYSDRFLIGSLISAAVIAYYTTPYEMITKLLIIPSALVGVLFPVFSASFVYNPEESKKFFVGGIKFVFLIIYPAILLTVSFAYEILSMWLGKDFAINSYSVLQYLSIGILMNSLSIIPNIFFQSTGKPKIPTLINLSELPFYLAAMWFAISNWGIEGASITYMIMAIVDATVMYLAAIKSFSFNFHRSSKFLIVLTFVTMLIIPFLIQGLISRLIFSSIIIIIFVVITFKYILSLDEKMFFKNRIHSIINKPLFK
jgi:O-antigen/teichoic acid export membrane protein